MDRVKKGAIFIRCSDEEAEKVRQAAKSERRTVSGFILNAVERIMVLHRGSVLAEGTPDEIRNHPGVQEAFLGRET